MVENNVKKKEIKLSCVLKVCRMEPVYVGPGIATWEHKGEVLRMSGNFEIFECRKCGRHVERMVNFK